MLPNHTLLHNRYRIEKKIGQGGMGAVYKAYDEALRTMVAVKEAHVSDKALLAAFRMEAIRLARLRHPALPNVTDHFVDGHGQYLVMEYIEGEDLGEMLVKRGKPFSVAEVLEWGSQLLAVLEYLHRQQPPIIHRDIKPPNLKLMPDKTLILLDFGLAKGGVTTIHTITGSIPGYTIGYAPLEQMRQGYKSDARSDLYAVGATLWTLLTAQLPVDAQVREQAVKHRIPDPLRPANEWNRQVPLPIAELLSQALALDAKNRPDSASTMQQQLQYEMQRATRERQQAEEVRRQAELSQFRRQAEEERQRREQAEQQAATTHRQAQQEADTARRQAQQERQRREQAEQDAEAARRANQTKPSPQPTTLSYPLVFGVIALILLALIAGGVISDSLRESSPEPTAVAAAAAAEEPTEVPSEPTETPSELTETPSEPTEAPSEPTEAPAESTATAPPTTIPPTEMPIPPTETPIPPTETPVPPTETPVPPTETSVPELGIGSTRVAQDGMTLMHVPAGDFLMGSEDSDAYDNEKPEHIVNLDAYWIDKTEVTNEMFGRFVEETSYQTEAKEEGWAYVCADGSCFQIEGADWQHPQGPESNLNGLETHPVVQVSWDDATTYCQWAGRRLPTEAEWEKAARGTDGGKYPWGEQAPTGELANFCDANCAWSWKDESVDDGYALTSPVGNYPAGASPYGALDMAGNVWEWVEDFHTENYNTEPTGSSSPEVSVEGPRVLRGGSWGYGASSLRAPNRARYVASVRGYRGFRCAASDS